MTIIWVMLGIFAFSKMESLQNPRPYYSEFPHSISILSSNLNWAQTSDGLRLYLSGVLTNTSPVSWKDVEFDCRFYDGHGSLLDASPGRGYLTLLPGDDGAFRVAIVPLAPTNQYASFSIRVANARNTKGWF